MNEECARAEAKAQSLEAKPRAQSRKPELLLRRFNRLKSFRRDDRGRVRDEEIMIVEVAIHTSGKFCGFRPIRRAAALQEDYRHDPSDVGVRV